MQLKELESEQKIKKLEAEILDYKNILKCTDFKNQETLLTLYQIINSIDARIYWKDLNGKFLGMNTSNLESLGANLKLEDVVGRLISEILPERSYHTDVNINDLKVMHNNKIMCFEEQYFINKEQQSTCLSSKSPLKNDLEQIIGMVGVSIDINQQKELQKEIENKNKLLIQQNIELHANDERRLEAKTAIVEALLKV